MPQKRRHKSPFVVTIASVTVSLGSLAACGGSTADDLKGTGGTGAQGGSSGSGSVDPRPPRSSPSAQPRCWATLRSTSKWLAGAPRIGR